MKHPVSQGLSSDLARVVITDGHRSHKAEQRHCLQQRACVDVWRARWTLISWEELALALVRLGTTAQHGGIASRPAEHDCPEGLTAQLGLHLPYWMSPPRQEASRGGRDRMCRAKTEQSLSQW